MKNVLIVDGANNCAYDIFQIPDAEFKEIFPGVDQDIAFESDIFSQSNAKNAQKHYLRCGKIQSKKEKNKGLWYPRHAFL